MTVHLNPIYHLTNAWDATRSTWGKSCIVLFYGFIWLQILWALELVIWPRAGWECLYQGLSEYAANGLETYIVGMNILTIGFYLYADRGGIKLWNISMVFVFNAWWSMRMLPGFKTMNILEGAPQGCDDIVTGVLLIFRVLFWWSFAALVCSVMEHISSPGGTPAENAPIV